MTPRFQTINEKVKFPTRPFLWSIYIFGYQKIFEYKFTLRELIFAFLGVNREKVRALSSRKLVPQKLFHLRQLSLYSKSLKQGLN